MSLHCGMRPTELDETNKPQTLVGRGKFPTRSGDLSIGSELKYVVDILKPLVFLPFSNSRLQKGGDHNNIAPI